MNQKKPSHQPKKTKSNNRNRTRAVHDYTAGGVVFRRKNGGLEFLLIQDLKDRWSIPKGHVESGEALESTALREITEETGLKNLQIIEKLDKIHFFHRVQKQLIFTTTFVFLIESTNLEEPVVVENSEGITDARWFREAEALKAIEYKDTKILVELAAGKIKAKVTS